VARESKEDRADRQAMELWRFVTVLRDAGNVVEEELRFDQREADTTQEPAVPRKWRFDVALPNCEIDCGLSGNVRITCGENIAIEIEGYGRHQSMKGFTADLEKYGEAFAQGWTLLRVSRSMIADGTALDLLARRGVRVVATCTHSSGQTTEGNCAKCVGRSNKSRLVIPSGRAGLRAHEPFVP